MNNPAHWVAACFLLFASVSVSAAPDRLLVTGTASSLETGNIVYREYHDITEQQHTVRYVSQDEKLIASKDIFYSHGFNTPEYELHDKRFERRTGSQWQDGHFIVFRTEKSEKPHQKKITPEKNTVIDAGFDHFIRENWNALVNGEVLPFSFVVADPLVILNMNIEEVDAEHTAIKQHSNQYRYFFAHSRNRLIGWAIPDIHLAYDSNSHLLQLYQGPSNLTDQHDKSQNVLIRYEYQRPATANAGEQAP